MAHVSDQSSKRTLETSNESASSEPTAKKSKKSAPTSADPNVAVKSKKKTAVDSNAPKRANTAFILFSQAERASIKLEHPEASNTDIYKRLGEKWREASAETKAKYEAEYKANKAKADAEMRAYLATSTPTTGGSVASSSNEKAGSAKSKSTRATTPPTAQKRGGSAFILFSQAERANIKKESPDVSNAEIFKRLGEKWREASAETKAKYEAEYKANKASVSGSAPVQPLHSQCTVVVEETSIATPATTAPVCTPDDPAPASNLPAALLKSKPQQQPGGGKARKSKAPAHARMHASETLLV
jgi:hypothetical protein